MSVIVPLSILAGGLGLKQEIDEIGQRKADTAYREAQTAYVNQQAAMAAWQLERARADELEQRQSNAALGQFYGAELQGELNTQRAAPGFGPSMDMPTPFGPVRGENVLRDTPKTTRLQTLARPEVWDALSTEAKGLALQYAEREDASEAIGRGAADLINSIDLAVLGEKVAPEEAEPFKALLGELTGDPAVDSKILGDAREAWLEIIQKNAKAQEALEDNAEVAAGYRAMIDPASPVGKLLTPEQRALIKHEAILAEKDADYDSQRGASNIRLIMGGGGASSSGSGSSGGKMRSGGMGSRFSESEEAAYRGVMAEAVEWARMEANPEDGEPTLVPLEGETMGDAIERRAREIAAPKLNLMGLSGRAAADLSIDQIENEIIRLGLGGSALEEYLEKLVRDGALTLDQAAAMGDRIEGGS